MADLAVLGLQIESDGAVAASANLDKLTASAAKAETATLSAGKASEQASQRMGGMSKASERMLASMERLEKTMLAQERAMGLMGASLTGIAGTSAAAVRSLDMLTDAVQKLQVVGNGRGGGGGGRGPLAPLNDNLPEVGAKAKLTANQIQGLGFQINDIGTMLAMGSSPFQILASQAGQVLQVLQEGGGIRASLSAIGGSLMTLGSMAATALGPIGFAFAGVTAAAGAFALIMRKSIPDANTTLLQHRKILAEVADQYEGISDVLEEIGKRANVGIKIELGATADNLKKIFSDQMKQAERQFVGGGGIFGTSLFGGDDTKALPSLPKFGPIQKMVDDFRASLRDGDADVLAFSNSLNDAYQTAGDDTAMRKAIQAAQDLVKPLLETATALDQTSAAATGAAASLATYRSAMDDLRSLTPDLRTEAEKVNDAFSKASAAAAENSKAVGDGMVALFQKQRAMGAITAEANGLLDAERSSRAVIGLGEEARAVAEVNQRYDALAKTYAGNAEALIAVEKARAQGISNAGAQAAFDRDQEASKEAEAAAKRATAEAERYAEATRSRIAGIDQSVAAQQMELETLGQSEGAAAALRFEFQALSAAKQAAAQAGGVVSEEEVAAIQRAAGEIGTLTDQIKAMRNAQEQAKRVSDFEQDLGFERSIIGLPEAEQQVRETLHGLGVAYDSFDGQRLAGEIRYNDSLRETQDQLRETGEIAEDAFGGFIDALARGGDLMQNLLGFAKDLGQQSIRLGVQKLIGNPFGGLQSANEGTAGIGPLLTATTSPAAGLYASSGGADYNSVASAPMRALNDNLKKVGRSALDVAKQFSGLNERADSKVLDGFLRASGNWNGLSAKDTAWCAAFANAAISETGGQGTGSNLASSFMGWGTGTNAPKIGDIVVLKPQASGASGHVGFVAGFGDGTVQVFGGNQSGGANTKSFGTDQVRGYRTAGNLGGLPIDDAGATQRLFAKGVTQGMTDFSRLEGPQMSKQAQAAMSGGWDGFSHNGAGSASGGTSGGITGRLQNLLKSPFGQGAMNALGAFGAGVSGGPISGALTGGLGAIGMGLGPVGIAAGIGAGILGSLAKNLFNKKEREAKHREQAATWANMQPDYLKWQDSIKTSMPTSGLSDYFAEQTANFDKFRETGGAAWKYGKNNSTQDFIAVGTAMYQQFTKIREAFRETVDPMIAALNAGRGMDSPFADARNQLVALGQQLNLFIDDTKESYWNLPDQAAKVAEATEAARQQVIKSFDVAEPLSAIGDEMQRLDGAAVGAKKVLMDLGDSAEDAGTIINEKLAPAIARIGENLTKELQAQLEDLDGKGYLGDFGSLIDEDAQRRRDISTYGLAVDPALVSEVFQKTAQSLVDGAELTGEAFTDLITAFPSLAGVVHEFVDEVTRTASQLKDVIAGYDDRTFAATNDGSGLSGQLALFDRQAQKEREAETAAGGKAMVELEQALAAERLKIVRDSGRQTAMAAYEASRSQLQGLYDGLDSFSDSLKDFVSGMNIGDGSTLSAKDQLAEAKRIYDETYAAADNNDADARDRLLSVAQTYLDADKAYNVSSEAHAKTFSEVQSGLKAMDLKTTSQLDLMRSSASWLEKIDANTLTVAQALKDYLDAQKTLDKARDWGSDPTKTKGVDAALRGAGLNYTGDYVNGQFASWARSQLPSQQKIIEVT